MNACPGNRDDNRSGNGATDETIRRARVVEAYSNRGVARHEDGRLAAFHFPRRLDRPLPGDWIELSDNGSLEVIAERCNTFGRGDPRGRFRPVAANLDLALIIIAAEPAPSPDLLHRYLAACRICAIEPVVVVNKSDLNEPAQPPFTELDGLIELGYHVVRVQCKPEPDIQALASLLGQGTSLLAGQSGVGKSSLVNALIPDYEQQTGELSRVTGKGTHTTTSATLCALPAGGWLLDTPGVWEYGLWIMPRYELLRGFPEFAPFADHCRFRDCSHQHEPGCAVSAAAQSGELANFRYQAWLRLLNEQARLSR